MGRDTFDFNTGDGSDTITAFAFNWDKIDLEAFGFASADAEYQGARANGNGFQQEGSSRAACLKPKATGRRRRFLLVGHVRGLDDDRRRRLGHGFWSRRLRLGAARGVRLEALAPSGSGFSTSVGARFSQRAGAGQSAWWVVTR